MPVVIAFEGIDGSGKRTQINLFGQHLQRHCGKSVLTRDYPVYMSTVGCEIGQMLEDGRAASMDSKSMAMWYAMDRVADYKRAARVWEQVDFVLLNRYTLSNAVFQSLRSPDPESMQQWVLNLEHNVLGLPYPDYYMILDVHQDLAVKNVAGRNKPDSYEADKALQAKARKLYLDSWEWLQGSQHVHAICWGIADFKETPVMLPEREIHRRVLQSLGDAGLDI